MLYAINYGNKKWKRARNYNSKTVKKIGKADVVISYTDNDIDNNFYQKNKFILSLKRGNGYWLWKPYFVNKTLDMIKEGDYLFYSDSGSFCISDIHILIDYMEKDKNDIMLFGLEYKEKIYAKRDAFILMDCDEKKYYDTTGCMAGFILLKKTKRTEAIIKEWLKYAQDFRIITDAPNVCGRPNYEGFIENRHDQTALSLTAKKYNCKFYNDLTKNDYEFISNGGYPKIMELHRNRFVGNKFEYKLFKVIFPIIMPYVNKIRGIK